MGRDALRGLTGAVNALIDWVERFRATGELRPEDAPSIDRVDEVDGAGLAEAKRITGGPGVRVRDYGDTAIVSAIPRWPEARIVPEEPKKFRALLAEIVGHDAGDPEAEPPVAANPNKHQFDSVNGTYTGEWAYEINGWGNVPVGTRVWVWKEDGEWRFDIAGGRKGDPVELVDYVDTWHVEDQPEADVVDGLRGVTGRLYTSVFVAAEAEAGPPSSWDEGNLVVQSRSAEWDARGNLISVGEESTGVYPLPDGEGSAMIQHDLLENIGYHDTALAQALAAGDIVYRNGTGEWTNLAIGDTTGQVLTVSGGLPVWADVPGGGGIDGYEEFVKKYHYKGDNDPEGVIDNTLDWRKTPIRLWMRLVNGAEGNVAADLLNPISKLATETCVVGQGLYQYVTAEDPDEAPGVPPAEWIVKAITSQPQAFEDEVTLTVFIDAATGHLKYRFSRTDNNPNVVEAWAWLRVEAWGEAEATGFTQTGGGH